MSRNEVLDENGERPQMSLAKRLSHQMALATKVADKKATLNITKIERALAFVELGEKAGFSAQGMVNDLRNCINLAMAKEDTRALTRLMELSNKMFMETAQNIGDQVIKLTQTQIKIDGKDGGKPQGLTEEQVNNLLIEQLKESVAE